MALVLIPSKVVSEAPQLIQYLLGSPITIAALSAIILNLLMSNKQTLTAERHESAAQTSGR